MMRKDKGSLHRAARLRWDPMSRETQLDANHSGSLPIRDSWSLERIHESLCRYGLYRQFRS